MVGIDADYGMSQAFNAGGWPTFVVIDAAGTVRFDGFDSDRNLGAVRRCLHGLLANSANSRSAATKPVLDRKIAFPAEVQACREARRDRSPRLAFDQAGQAQVIFYSNRDGINAIYLRRYLPDGKVAAEERLSPATQECYGADCAIDPQGTLWVTWCGRSKEFYDIYAWSRAVGRTEVTEQLCFSDDDAMSPKIAVGADGTVAVAYYKWHRLWGYSRDRDLYARVFDGARHTWGKETEISPHQPEVEDHTDPDVVVDPRGAAWFVWSFDYHPEIHKPPVDASQPTIFAAHAVSNTVSPEILVGATGGFRGAVDLFPTAALDDQAVLWCAWDCSEPSRCIRLSRLGPGGNDFRPVNAFGQRGEVCSTPELSPAKDNRLLLAWSQRSGGDPWRGKVALLEEGRSVAETSLAEPADVQFPQAQQGPDGQYWVVYEKTTPKGSEIVLRNLTKELQITQKAPGS
jgi:hypothetical protein